MNLTDAPLVSAVIPVYNGEKFLAETIESVLMQTYPNIECVVVNDGSTDGTAQIARSFGDKIRYFEKTNGGVSSARNYGIEQAKGEFIAFLDADDLWLPEKTVKQLDALRQNESAGLIYSGVRIIDERKSVISEIKQSFQKDVVSRILLLETPVYLTMTGIVPRKIFNEIGKFDENLSTSADADMACRIGLAYPIIAVDEPLAMYRQHSRQMHLNLETLEHDANILFDKNFNYSKAAEGLLALKSKAYSNLETTLAIGYFKQKKYRRFFQHLCRAFLYNPMETYNKIFHLTKNKINS